MVGFIVAENTDSGIEEIGYLGDISSIDIDIGGSNDLQLKVPLKAQAAEIMRHGLFLYRIGTEYGGIINDMQSVIRSGELVCMGYTFRGLLDKKIIEPDPGQSHKVVSGDANRIIEALIKYHYSNSIFRVPGEDSKFVLKDYKFNRYCTLLEGITAMLESVGARLQIASMSDAQGVHVELRAVPLMDLSDEIEYSQDGRVNFTVRDYRMGVNHLICLGKGELTDRLVVHLYIDKNGEIGQKKYYTGLEDISQVYELSSEDNTQKLITEGTKKLKELMNYKSATASVQDVDLNLGDIIGGRDRITGILVKAPIIQKIFTINSGRESISYKTKGE